MKHMSFFSMSIVLMTLFLSACAKTPPPKLSLVDPSSTTIRVKSVTYSNVSAGYESSRPIGPKDWMKTNQSVAPRVN